ncbi:MAG: ATP-binding cassette domain-containing protein, partial [Melioribacteraceae bacterium]|nr:ATP-binding cassette domain-containing protein [Melioribacteraceae bacterium]
PRPRRCAANNIGFVFQMFHLLPYLSLFENVTVPTFGEQKVKAEKILKELGLGERINHKPYALSAGEKQRTAVARALINDPKIILADEPTGNLDPENAAEVMRIFSQFKENGGTVVVVTHGTEANEYADRIIFLKNGKIVEK